MLIGIKNEHRLEQLPNSRKERIRSLSTQFQDIKSPDKLSDHCDIAETLKLAILL